MSSPQLFLTFIVTTALFAYMPGPAMLYAAAQTIARGRRSGMMATLGIHVGCYVHVVAAAAGLSLLFHAAPLLYTIVKLGGAAYLIWLGIAMWRMCGSKDATAVTIQPKTGGRAFLESIAVEVLNPKTAIFFLAFLPQFIDPSATLPIWAQFLILGTIVNLMFSSADVACVLMAGAVLQRLKGSSRATRLMQRVGGTVLIGLGAHIALQKS
jgi:threonine/homoserine/homoserine lactone efflux protein